MNFLVCNDDGFDGYGIKILVQKLKKYGKCFVVAPNAERSCSSQAMTFNKPIKLEEIAFENAEKAYKIEGTPCDCTKIGLSIFKDIDIVFSGVNNGSNLGTDILYSGTLGAATQGNILNKKAVAISTHYHNFEVVEKKLDDILKYILLERFDLISHEYVLNINFPNTGFEKPLGIKFTFMGNRFFNSYFENVDGNELEMFPKGELLIQTEEEGSDCYYHDLGYITMTPVGLNRTNYYVLQKFKNL